MGRIELLGMLIQSWSTQNSSRGGVWGEDVNYLIPTSLTKIETFFSLGMSYEGSGGASIR